MSAPATPGARIAATHIEVVRAHKRPPWLLIGAAIVASISAALWFAGVRPSRLWSKPTSSYAVFQVDRGDVPRYIVESGALESANNTIIKCKVEALIGLVGGTQQGQQGAQNKNAAGQQGGTTAGGAAGTTGATGANAPAANTDATKKAATTKTAGATAQRKLGQPTTKGAASVTGTSGTSTTSAGGSTAGGTTSGGTGGAAGGAGATGMAGGATGGAGGGVTTAQRPDIESFSFTVDPHTPLRPATAQTNQAATKKAQTPQQGMQGQGGNNMQGQQERPGSTRILWIATEGTRVKKDDVICRLDSASFSDELAAQKIRYLQANSYVEQGVKALEVAEISLREYRDGVYPKDQLLIAQYIETCKIQLQGASDTYESSKRIQAKGLISPEQLNADKISKERAIINLREAYGMRERLENYTAKKLIKNLEAKIDSIRADLLAQKAAFELEKQRKERLERNIENCTLVAPSDGIVGYAVQGNGWGRVDNQIAEGVTVREGQNIITLPDPKHMRVKAKINESKMADIHPGQQAVVRVDAFPGKEFTGTVAEITPIPTQAMGPFSDIKSYFAMVDVELGEFDGLRTGMSAEVGFYVGGGSDVVRVPLSAVRWVGGRAFVALPAAKEGFQWRLIEVGTINPSFAEVRSGLAPGEAVIADPDGLPAPQPGKGGSSVARVAARPQPPRGS
jgi:multidrug resistance efflux pump